MTTESIFEYRYAPFSDTFEIKEPFLSQSDEKTRNRFVRFLSQGRSMVLYGDPGTGKSMMIKSIVQQLDPKTYKPVVAPYGGVKRNILLKELCDEFGIDTSGRGSHLTRLRKYFSESKEAPFPVIVIDDAHDMEKESFMDLCTLMHHPKNRKTAASVILAGHTCLKTKLSLDIFAPIKTRMTCLFEMPALTIEEAVSFIEYRLKISGMKQSPFDDESLRIIAADSSGNRRKLMNLCINAMELANERREKVITADLVNAMDIF